MIKWIEESKSSKPEDNYPKVFEDLGLMQGEYKILLKRDVTPYSVNAARRIPIPMMDSVKLDNLEKQGVVERVQEPSEWCALMIPQIKPNRQIRICVDYTQINEFIEREKYYRAQKFRNTMQRGSGC